MPYVQNKGNKGATKQRATVHQPAVASCFVTAKPALKILPIFSPVDVEWSGNYVARNQI